MKKIYFLSILSLFFVPSIFSQDCYVLSWSDEFNGNQIDPEKWTFDIGNGYPDEWGWGNGEDQYYTNKPENVEVSNGTLKIKARNESVSSFNYTSAKIKTQGLFDFKYGRIESRIKIPKGGGLWPAFWLLPSENVFGEWPASGEIDIMERFGDKDATLSSIHFKNTSGQREFKTDGYAATDNQWHNFAAVWSENEVNFFVDWNFVMRATPADLKGANWPFNENFYLILNMAMGGDAGAINNNGLPKNMEIDWIRVYQRKQDLEIQGTAMAEPNSIDNHFWLPENASTYSWSVPAGAEILSGQGTNKIQVKWGNGNGNVSCNVNGWNGDINGNASNCGNNTITKSVTGLPSSCHTTIYDGELNHGLLQTQADGVGGIEALNMFNPKPNNVNPSNTVIRYGRDGDQQYDIMKVQLRESFDAERLRNGKGKLYVDLYTDFQHSGNIPVTVEIVNRNANNAGYPKGIYAQLLGTITKSREWETVEFTYLETPDWDVLTENVDAMNVLLNPNSNTAKVYFIDNIRLDYDGYLPTINGDDVIEGHTNKDEHTFTIDGVEGVTAYEWSATGDASVESDGTTGTVTFFNKQSYISFVTVEMTTSEGCTETMTKNVEVGSATILSTTNEVIDQGFSIYPNPTAGAVSIKSVNDISVVNIKTVNGTVVSSFDNAEHVNLSSLKAGMYVIELIGSDNIHTQKIIKK